MTLTFCDTCNKAFKDRKEHVEHSGGNLHCIYCSRSLPNLRQLAQHENGHDPKEKCPLQSCSLLFKTGHYQKHCQDTHPFELIQCQYESCGQRFNVYRSYARHVQRDHGNETFNVILDGHQPCDHEITLPEEIINYVENVRNDQSMEFCDSTSIGSNMDAGSLDDPEDIAFYEVSMEDNFNEALKKLVRKMDSKFGIPRTQTEEIFKDISSMMEDWTNCLNSILTIRECNYKVEGQISVPTLLRQPIVKRKKIAKTLMQGQDQPEIFPVGVDLQSQEEALMYYNPVKNILERLMNDVTFQEKLLLGNLKLKDLKNSQEPIKVYTNLYNDKMKELVDRLDDLEHVIIICFYSDGVRMDAKSCRKTLDRCKLNFAYISILNLEHKYTRHKEHWSLVYCHHEKGANRDRIYLRFIQEMEELVLLGYEHSGRKYKIIFHSITGDMLERQSLCGIMRNGAFGCPVTYISLKSRKTAKTYDELEAAAVLRTPQAYSEDLEQFMTRVPKPDHVRGVSNNCYMNQIPTFNFTSFGSNVPCMAHDIYVGAANHDCSAVLHLWTSKKLINCVGISNALSIMQSNLQKKDKSEFPGHQVTGTGSKSFKVKGNISQNMYFLRFFCVTFKDFAQTNNLFESTEWKLMVKWKHFCDYLECSEMSSAMLDGFTQVKQELLELRIAFKAENENIVTQNLNLKPKHCSLIFYDKMIRRVGPLKHYSSLVMERKHSTYKELLNKKTNFATNLIQGVSQKETLRLDELDQTGRYIHEEYSFGKKVPQKLLKSLRPEAVQLINDFEDSDISLAVNSVTILRGTTIVIGQVVTYNSEQDRTSYEHGRVELILPDFEGKDTYLCLTKLITCVDQHTHQVFIEQEVATSTIVNLNRLACKGSCNIYLDYSEKSYFVLAEQPYIEN